VSPRSAWIAAAVALAALTPSTSYAQPARALASPWRGSSAPSPTAAIDVSPHHDIHPSTSSRRFGDGHADEVPWEDPELDLRPSGYVHGGLFGMGGVITATSHAPLSPDLALGLFVDVALEPRLSLHLRVGAVVRARFAGDVAGADGRRGEQASLSGRGFALVGAHFFQVAALRIGFEVGGSTVLGGRSGSSGVGYAAVLQLGVRFDDGHLELVVDGAMDSHEIFITGPASTEVHFGDQPSPRLLLGLIGEFG
jgi:hypothetical protein